MAGSMDHLVIYNVALPSGQKLQAGDDEDIYDVQLYPNPAANTLTISCSEFDDQNFSLMIFDLTGKLLNGNTVASGDLYEADLSSFLPGVYLVKVYDEQHQFMTARKFVHQ